MRGISRVHICVSTDTKCAGAYVLFEDDRCTLIKFLQHCATATEKLFIDCTRDVCRCRNTGIIVFYDKMRVIVIKNKRENVNKENRLG